MTLAGILAPRTNPERSKLPTELPPPDAAKVYLRRFLLLSIVVLDGAVVLLLAILIDCWPAGGIKLELGFFLGLLLSSLFRNIRWRERPSSSDEEERLRQKVADLRRKLGMQ